MTGTVLSMRALIYTRVSQDRAGGRSPAEQETEARAECERHGWDVTEVITDSAGASRHSKGTRSGWARAKQVILARQVDVLVTWEASRAQRDIEAYAELRKLCVDAGVLWSYSGRVYDMTTGDDRFRTGLDALMAEREAEETAGRVQRAVRANAVAGRPHGRRLFGYQRIYDATSGALIGQEPLEDEAVVVRRIFDEYLAGHGLRTIARELNADGVSTSTGKGPWSDSQVYDVLRKPSYTGLRVHRGEIIGEANWPPLIDRRRWDRAQARLQAKRTSQTRQTRNANLLSGVGRCGVCLGKVQRGHDRNHRRTYLCKTKFCVGRDLVKLDAYVTAIVLERLSRPDVTTSAAPFEAPHVAAARASIDALGAQLDDALAEFKANRLSAGMLGRIEADLVPKIAAARKVVQRAGIPIEIDAPDGDEIATWWDDVLTPEQRREIVGAVVESVVIYPAKKRGARVFDPDSVEVILRQR